MHTRPLFLDPNSVLRLRPRQPRCNRRDEIGRDQPQDRPDDQHDQEQNDRLTRLQPPVADGEHEDAAPERHYATGTPESESGIFPVTAVFGAERDTQTSAAEEAEQRENRSCRHLRSPSVFRAAGMFVLGMPSRRMPYPFPGAVDFESLDEVVLVEHLGEASVEFL